MKRGMCLLAGFVFLGIFLFSVGIASAGCGDKTAEATCNSALDGDSCFWKSDSWGSWCEELNCWSFSNQTSCNAAVVLGKTCNWRAGGTSYGCEKVSCWSLSGTSEAACENNNKGLSCDWGESCYNAGSSTVSCGGITNSTLCGQVAGCAWGQCQERGCWSGSSTNSSYCNSIRGWNGKNCTWSESLQSCQDNGCWRYNDNSTYCLASAEASGLICEWKWNSCQDKGCWSFDFTNETACLNNTANLSCSWSGSYCTMLDCWSYNTNATCSQKENCLWKAWTSSGWCEELNCWSYDSINGGGNQTTCEAALGESCSWTGNPPGNTTNGWCYKDMSNLQCSNFTTERSCMDTYYCWWQYTDWMNASGGGSCNDPMNFGLETNNSIFNKWNPGCYIFDVNETDCNKVVGCNYTGSGCDAVGNEENSIINVSAAAIVANGINCSMINDSSMCNTLPMLSSCCSWQNGTCTENKYTTSCWDQMEEPPEGAAFCEDYNAYSNQQLCEQIANSPWYMPCVWNSTLSKCQFKSDDVFGNGSTSLVKIDNKKSCEAAGGKWIVENYCEGNVSVPSGRCEYKFSEESNCDKACFACELKDSNGNSVNATNARSACEGSALGICEFGENINSPNGVGYCNSKDQFKQGIAGDCDSNCGDCTFKGDSNSNDTTKRASYYCANSKANSDGGGCKWVADSSITLGGYCIKKGEKTCEDTCDRCTGQSDCQTLGRTAGNFSAGSCKWEGDSTSGSCVANIDGDVEVCWDAMDNDNDNLIDCADSYCYSDSYCGFVSGDCFGWATNDSCITNGCEWATDKWGSWCDFSGSQCWKYNQNENNCSGIALVVNEPLNISSARLANNNINSSYYFALQNLGTGWVLGSVSIVNNASNVTLGAANYTVNYTSQRLNFSNNTFMVSGDGSTNLTNVSYQYYLRQQTCKWTNDSYSTGWCENDWSLADTCMGLGKTACDAAEGSGCNWTADSWCSGLGNQTDWCSTQGGWCDYNAFKPKNCWMAMNSSSCDGISGCDWYTDSYSQPHCEVDWGINCWQYTTSGTCTGNCQWRSDQWGSWCDNKMNECWSAMNSTSCSVLGSKCYWQSWSDSSGSCQPACFNQTISQSSSGCSAVSGCMWKEENGWCKESSGCWNYNQAGCTNSTGQDAGCRWKEGGWCDPLNGFSTTSTTSSGGGGGGGMGGGDCWKYDGNQTSCTNTTITGTSCSWMTDTNPHCEVNWGGDCWQYNSTNFGCNSTNGCWWNPGTGGASGWCSNIMDQCWGNQSYQSWNNTEWAGNCSTNPLCTNNSWGGCEPRCFGLDSDSCTNETYVGKCKYLAGWCNPSGVGEMFDQMENGAPAPIGVDSCGPLESVQASADLCGFGMKDMGNSYGFGANVFNFENASACNKEKLSSFVMGMFDDFALGGVVGGFGGGSGSERIGSGNDTVSLFIYLDTDGSTSGGCTLSHNSSAAGYEFRLKYVVTYNSSNDKIVETFNSYKCDNSDWKVTDIQLSALRQKMCSEIGGPMLAVKKDDLAKYPTLYDSTRDMRVYVATAGNAGNISSPLDTAGPGWISPGSIDFDISDAFGYGADSAKFEDILRNGFVKGENCFDSIDADGDGYLGCDDWDCQYSSSCTGEGVNEAGYVDTMSPQVTGVNIEEYPDSALLMYTTNKPTNGSLLFYKNDSQCLAQNVSISDSTVLTNTRDFLTWHDAEIYSETLGYSLAADTVYYYKLKVCDSANKCAVSKCSNFRTSTTTSCGYCNFVTRIKAPIDWDVLYDLNTDGTYEHIQGEVCGPNAGMKTNYTNGRKAHIRLQKSDGSVYIEFLNVSLSKSGLNDKVRTINSSEDVISDSAKVGLSSESRDKIINNLHPEACKVKIPKASDGSCSVLYHCDDNGENCVNRTAAAGGAPVDSTNCVWNVPYCEFSTYKTAAGSTLVGGNTGPGGGGGGGAAANKTVSNTSVSEEGDTGADEEEKAEVGKKVKDYVEEIVGGLSLKVVLIVLAGLGVCGFVIWYALHDKRKKYLEVKVKKK